MGEYCDNVEYERTFWMGMLIRMSSEQLLSRQIVFGNLESAVWRGQSGKENEWTDGYRATSRRLAYRGTEKRWR